MILLGAQYYRPPFPNEKYWRDDLKKMADSGLNTVQLWVKWAWVEPAPGDFRFDDYDRLVAEAGRAGLGVVLSTIAEIQPYWIHREVPDCELVDNLGHKIISDNRGECHFGLTPGGCTDHPGVWERMAQFLRTVGERYRGAPNLRGWDVWNELRWNVHADGLVCYCPHTIARFREWLDQRYGGIEGLNRAWQRRYASWEDVRPGKVARSPYTEMMAFEHFITVRSNRHAKARYEVLKGVDPDHPVTVHGDSPSVLHGDSYPGGTALYRGNDWAFADHLDGIGTSSFPHWGGIDHADFAVRIDCTASAARGKRIWLSELQGGRASTGFRVHTPVPEADQQKWLWTGISRGADAVLFWCWRDEVFGCESAGFGLDGRDGYRETRLAAMRKTGEIVRAHDALLSGFRPDPPSVGVWFSPQSYYLHWAEERHGYTAQAGALGVARALTRRNLPYRFVEEEHLDALEGLRVLFLPRTLVVDDEAAQALSEFVRKGGTLVTESECGAFGSNGIYREPEERFLAALTGVREIGRRNLSGHSLAVRIDGQTLQVPAKQWLTPFEEGKGTVWARSEDGPSALEVAVGKGRVAMFGTYFGDAYLEGASGKKKKEYAGLAGNFEALVEILARRAGVTPTATAAGAGKSAKAMVHVQAGRSGGRRVVFVFSAEARRPPALQFPAKFLPAGMRDLLTGKPVSVRSSTKGQTCRLASSDWGIWVLAGAPC